MVRMLTACAREEVVVVTIILRLAFAVGAGPLYYNGSECQLTIKVAFTYL